MCHVLKSTEFLDKNQEGDANSDQSTWYYLPNLKLAQRVAMVYKLYNSF